MTTPRPDTASDLFVTGLSQIAASYPAIICDVWGVLHNGKVATPGAGDALARFRRQGGKVSLLTNAPRPAGLVIDMLRRFGIPDEAYDTIVTSGDVTTDLLKAKGETVFYHIGPERDLDVYRGAAGRLGTAQDAETIVVTGLFDDETEVPEDYRASLSELAARKLEMICANPDLVVERGGSLIYCAGAIAKLYVELGGRVTYVGKPFKPVYDVARGRLEALVGAPLTGRQILAIGDGMPTDVAGAHANGIDLLFITAGIHASEFGDAENPDPLLVASALEAAGVEAQAVLPRLTW